MPNRRLSPMSGMVHSRMKDGILTSRHLPVGSGEFSTVFWNIHKLGQSSVKCFIAKIRKARSGYGFHFIV